MASTGNSPELAPAPVSEKSPDVQLVADTSGFPSEEIISAWSADSRCVECGERVASVADSALLIGPGRIAHREHCFVPALIRLNPLLNQLAARKRAKEVHLPSHTPVTDAEPSSGGPGHG